MSNYQLKIHVEDKGTSFTDPKTGVMAYALFWV